MIIKYLNQLETHLEHIDIFMDYSFSYKIDQDAGTLKIWINATFQGGSRFAFEGAQWNTLESEIVKPKNIETMDLCSILTRGVLIRKGLLLNWEDNDLHKTINGRAAALAILYFYLVSYATSFLGRTLNFDKYFKPFGGWNEFLE
ncbi:MAG: hypothetical protein ACFFDN_18570 [Candidatus Hodarchaeota archaeon]